MVRSWSDLGPIFRTQADRTLFVAKCHLQLNVIGQHLLGQDDTEIVIRAGRSSFLSPDFQTRSQDSVLLKLTIFLTSAFFPSLPCYKSFLATMTPALGMADGVRSSISQLSIEKEKNTGSSAVSDDFYPLPPDTKPEETSTENAQDMEILSRIATSDYPHAFKLTFIVVALVLSIFLVALDMTIVATAIPSITDEFHSLNQVGWYGSAFFLTVGAFQSTWGKAYKYFHLKPSFLVAIGIFELGSLICGVAQDSTTLIVGRAIAGMASAAHLFAQ